MSYNESTTPELQPVAADKAKMMQEILDFLKKGGEELELSPNEDVVLLLGNTGSGKSTVAQFVAGDPDELRSEEVEEGTGEFVIVDQRNKISRNSTVMSQTVFPELVKDPKSGVIFYDCPGFSDTRNPAFEIGATYFIKKILDKARSVKLVFVVSHHSVRKGVDRKDFMLLLKHTVDFVKAMDKYLGSIALVVTKVENIYTTVNGTPALVPDEKVATSVAKFINNVKVDIKQNPGLLNSGSGQAIDFLEALTFNINGSYPRIGIFRRPDMSGSLRNFQLLEKEKEFVKKIIIENIVFKKVEALDFGYTISASSKIHVNDLIEEINENMAEELLGLGQEVIGFFNIKEGNELEIEQLRDYFENTLDIFLKTLNPANEDLLSSREYLIQLRSDLDSLGVKVSEYHLSRIAQQEEYTDFLHFVSNQAQRKDKASKIAKGFSQVSKYLNNSGKWYSFLNDLYLKLSQYEIQKNLSAYNSDAVTPLLSNNGTVALDEIEFSSRLDQVMADTLEKYREIKGMLLNTPKQNSLKKVLDMTLKHEVSWNCTRPFELVVKGRYVKLSDVDKDKCGREIKSINIFALNKVFLDTSLDLTGREVQMAIVAPMWEVIGSQHIKLDGKPGSGHEPPKATGGYSGREGDDGQPGYPGGPAGSFLGMGSQFINEEQIEISANGGDGGKGQDGGDGSPGEDARASWDGPMTNLLPLVLYNRANYFILGRSGSDGGDGGAGGFGGLSGKVTILDVDHKTRQVKARISARKGHPGGPGRGGSGGLGGRHGDYVWRNYMIFITDEDIQHRGGRAASGRSGHDGWIGFGRENAREVKQQLNPLKVVSAYTKYVNDNLKDDTKGTCLKTFLNDIYEAEIPSRMKRNAKYYEMTEEGGTAMANIKPASGYRLTDIGDGERSHFMTSGSSSVSKNSLMSGMLDLAMGGLVWLRSGDVSSYQEVGGLPVDHDLPTDLNPGQCLHSTAVNGNLLLWEVLLKKFNGGCRTSRCNVDDDYEERVSFASSLAYRHYIP